MAWTITWLGDTRERFQELLRERYPKLMLPGDIGLLAIKKLEDDIRLHPLPAADLPQFRQDEVFRFGRVEVCYHMDSEKGKAEIRSVTAAQRWMGKLPKGRRGNSPPAHWSGPWPRVY